jgi:Tfp pilus assembly protein PilZ
VRLTNSNKLVGGILSQIADDHVVLEFRSNRVILPRSAVGEVVAGAQADGVRLGVTREEDNWVRELVEREVGKAVEPKKPTKAGGK